MGTGDMGPENSPQRASGALASPLPQPPGEWTSRKSLLVSNPGLPDHSFSDRSIARSETSWSSFGAHSGLSEKHRGSGRGGDLAKTLEPSRTSCKPRAPGTWYWPLPKFYAENARSLLQTCFLLWAHSQCDRKLTLHASDYRGSRVQHQA